MHARLTHRPFELFGIFQRAADELIGRFPLGVQLRRLLINELERRLPFGGRYSVGHEFRQAVALRKGKFLHPRHILYGQFRSHAAERHDLGHALFAVFFGHVVQHVGAAVLVEVHIHIRQRDTLRIEESFEQKMIFERVYIRYFKAVRNHRTGGRTSSGAYRYAHFASRTDEVPHDEEVARETHPLHGAQLVFEPLCHLLTQIQAVPHPSSLVCQPFQIAELLGNHEFFFKTGLGRYLSEF